MHMYTATDQPKIREYQNFTKARAICKSCVSSVGGLIKEE